MNIVQSKEEILHFPEGRKAVVYIDESKTNYYVSFRPITKALPKGWASTIGPIKVKKTRIVSNMLAAVNVAYKEYMKDDIWLWR